jgi:hypothetical protein
MGEVGSFDLPSGLDWWPNPAQPPSPHCKSVSEGEIDRREWELMNISEDYM